MRLQTFRPRGRRPRDTVLATIASGLSRMQRAVLFQASTGKSDKAIAQALGITPSTAKQHKHLARQRLGAELYRKAIFRNG